MEQSSLGLKQASPGAEAPAAAGRAVVKEKRKPAVSLDDAVQELIEFYGKDDNRWFLDEFWPANDHRVRCMLQDLAALAPAGSQVFDPGCGNGYMSFLASRIGFEVTATDAWCPPDRERLFDQASVRSFVSNLNERDPWPNLADKSFSGVLFGEVFEHLLNHPLGILQQLHRILKPQGVLIITTPNPSTLVNAVRVAFDKHTAWGTMDLARHPKFDGSKIIDKGEIHYREYRSSELCTLLAEAGFEIRKAGYVALGDRKEQKLKRITKRILGQRLMSHRLFGSSNYIVAISRD